MSVSPKLRRLMVGVWGLTCGDGCELRECVATELVCRSRDVSGESGSVQHVTAFSGAMHVARNKSSYVAKSGEERVYESVLLRRTYREGGKVKHETLANLSALPAEAVDRDWRRR